jgi:hypothetical protein
MTSSAAPSVTVGIPVFNGERYLAEALGSLQAQDYTDFEAIIADNASDDGTQEIARSFVDADPRFVYFRNDENIGGARNSNLLVEMARAPYFKWAYHDDLSTSDLLGGLHSLLEEAGPKTVVAYPRVALIDSDGRKVGEHNDADLDISDDAPHRRLAVVLKRVVGQVQFGLMRTEILRQSGGAPVDVGAEMVLPAALALRGKIALYPQQSLLIRVHEARHGGSRSREAAWVDPSLPPIAFPYARSTPLLFQAIRRAGLPSAEQRRCMRTVLTTWTRPGWRTLVGDLIRLPRDLHLIGR